MCDEGEDKTVEDAEDLITIVKRIDRRLLDLQLSRAMLIDPDMVDPDCYDEPTEGAKEPGPEEPSLEAAKRLLQRAESAADTPHLAVEYREQAEVWMMIHREEH